MLGIRSLRWLVAAALVVAWPMVQAQTVEDVTVLEQGDELLARVSFAGAVRLLQQTPVTPSQLYQIRLDFTGMDPALLTLPNDEVKRQAAVGGAPAFELLVKAAPRQKLRQMVLQMAETVAVRVKPGPNARSLDIVFTGLHSPAQAAAAAAAASSPPVVAPAPQAAASAGAEGAPQALTAVDVEGKALLDQALEAMAAKQNDRAIEILGRLLRLPPNVASQQAQELIGLAWERSGDTQRAKAEYELYLKLFARGDGADRVSQRLATLTAAPAKPEAASKPAAPAEKKPRFTFAGNMSQYYFGGKARSQSLVNLQAGIDQATLTRTTESALVTSVDISGRYLDDNADVRMSVRGTGATNLAKNSHNASNVSASNIDYRHPGSGTSVRIGRQTPANGGLLGAFDGVSVTYPLPERGMRISVLGGVPANTLVASASQRLAGATLELDSFADNWGGNFYVLGQTTEGYVNRSTVGSEVRYSSDVGSAYALMDYDTRFRSLNALSLQGTVQGSGQTSYNLMVDARRAPPLELTSALISAEFPTGQAATLKNLLAQMSMADALDMARKTSAIARQAMFSVTRPVSAKWQGTVDLRYSAVGALPAVGSFAATDATGAQYGATLQLTGSNLYSKRDIANFNLSVLSTPLFRGYQLGVNSLTGVLGDALSVEPSLRYYSQTDKQDGSMSRISPSLRLSYRLSKKASVMGETMLEHTKSNAQTNHDTTNSIFFYVGYSYTLF